MRMFDKKTCKEYSKEQTEQAVRLSLSLAKDGEAVGTCSKCGRLYIWMNPKVDRIRCLACGGGVDRVRGLVSSGYPANHG